MWQKASVTSPEATGWIPGHLWVPCAFNARFVAETYTHAHTAIKQALGYYRYLSKQAPNAQTRDYCDAVRLIAKAESKLAKTLTNLEIQEAA